MNNDNDLNFHSMTKLSAGFATALPRNDGPLTVSAACREVATLSRVCFLLMEMSLKNLKIFWKV